MKYLVVTNKHELHPLANLLLSEDLDVDVVVWKRRYEAAWAGRLNLVGKFSQGEMSRETWDPYKELAKAGELVVLTNVPRVWDIFGIQPEEVPPWFFGSQPSEGMVEPIRFGGWVHQGEICLPHILVYDLGLWPGGLGPQLPGGVTLISLQGDEWQRVLPVDELHRGVTAHQGLFNAQFETLPTGELGLSGLEFGWSWLQTAALVANVSTLQSLVGFSPSMDAQLEHKYSTALPFSIPPFPVVQGKAPAGLEMQGLSEAQVATTLWHDVVIDQENRSLVSAGLDGLLGVSSGSGHTHLRAAGLALSVPQGLEVPELQWRVDLGHSVALAEMTLENLGLRV
jgi:hypothetical protein